MKLTYIEALNLFVMSSGDGHVMSEYEKQTYIDWLKDIGNGAKLVLWDGEFQVFGRSDVFTHAAKNV